MDFNRIKVYGFRGFWHVIDEKEYFGEMLYLLEHNTYGDETEGLIIDKNGQLIKDDVWNGFDDLDEEFSWYDFCNYMFYEKGDDSLGHYDKNFVNVNREYYHKAY